MKKLKTNDKSGGDQHERKNNVQAEIAASSIPPESQHQQEENGEIGAQKFVLSYEPDGVYFTVSCGAVLSLQEQEWLIRHFSRKRLHDIDMGMVLKAVSGAGAEHFFVAPPQREIIYNETYTVSVSSDMMEASMTLLPPEPGCGKRLEEGQVLQELGKLHQINFGIEREALHELLETPIYGQPKVIARGTPPVAGVDGRLEWHIDRREGPAVYRIRETDENEKVDYKNLDLFVQVNADQLLVTRVPPKEGTSGRTVLGREMPPKSGRNYLLPQGKNTYITKDGLELRAAVPGRVDEVNGRLEVSNLYQVLGDVDLGVGNINFDGDVVIGGNVCNGFTIKATGSIEVKGIVEAAALEAGGDIFIEGGIQGGGKGILQAQGGVYARFAEYATIQAGSIVSAQSLLHSNVNCLGAVEVVDGRGSIIGGNVCAGTYIAAQLLGNPSGRATELQVGLSPHSRVKMAEMEKMVDSLKKVVDRLQEVLQETPDSQIKTQREQEVRMENVRKLLQYKKLMLDKEAELQEIRDTLSDHKSGEVHALNTAYPGVNISIGLGRTILTQSVTYATFRKIDGNIDFTTCRFRPRAGTIKKRMR